MKIKSIVKLSSLLILVLGILLGCTDDASFGNDVEVQVLPTSISYPDLVVNESSIMESAVPNFNSNGHPVTFDVISGRRGTEVLDASYMDNVDIVNPQQVESTVPDANDPDNEWTVITEDLTDNGKIVIDDASMFTNGDYYFTVEASVEVNGNIESVTFEDALHLQVGWANGMAYCPRRVNFVAGEGTMSGPGEVIGGRDNFRLELASDQEKLVIDPMTGVISMNPSYTIMETESVTPTIKLVYDSNESVPVYIDGSFTAVLSTEAVELEKEKDYFFFPTLTPYSANVPAGGGDGYTVNTADFASKPGWVQKHFYKVIVNAAKLEFQEALDTRAEAGVSAITGSQFNYWGPLANPFESWFVANAVNLSAYAGCFDTKMVFWLKHNIPQGTLDDLFPTWTETPVRVEIKISDAYTGDVATTTWTDINESLTCTIGESGSPFVGTPYPISGEVGPEGNANNIWVKCEMDLPSDMYGDIANFTIAFRNKTNYDTDLSGNLRGEFYISDLYFVASEK